MLWEAGGDILNADNTQAAFNSDAGVQALTTLQQMAVTDKSVYLDQQNTGKIDTLFNSGKIAMDVTGPWALSGYPDINYGVQIMPSYPGGSHATIAGPDMWVMFDNNGHGEAAWQFMQWLTAAEQVKADSMESGHLPIRNSVVQEPGFLDAFDKKFPGEGLFAQNLTNVTKARPVITSYDQISRIMGEAIVKVMLGQGDPKTVVGRRREPGEPGVGGRLTMAVAARQQTGAPGFARRALTSDHLTGWLFVLPAVFLIALFSIFPIIWGFILSLQKASLISPNRPFVGFDNYTHIASDPVARQAAVNAVVYTCLFVPTSIIIALFLAIALNQKIRLIRFYRLAVFIPVAVSTIATGRDVHVGVRRELRARELGARRDRPRTVRMVRLAARGDALARDHDRSGAGSGSTRSSTSPRCKACRTSWSRPRPSTARRAGRSSGT